jgi:hypothetical protein
MLITIICTGLVFSIYEEKISGAMVFVRIAPSSDRSDSGVREVRNRELLGMA